MNWPLVGVILLLLLFLVTPIERERFQGRKRYRHLTSTGTAAPVDDPAGSHPSGADGE